MQKFNPATIAPPVGAYSHGISHAADAEVLYVSGQVGIDRDGTIAADTRTQSEVVWSNIAAILHEAGMGLEHLVKVTAYLTDVADLPEYGAVRTAVLGDLRPCSTLVIVKDLVRPEWKVEVEVIAARPAR